MVHTCIRFVYIKSKIVNNENIALVQGQSKMKTWLRNVNRFKTHIYSFFFLIIKRHDIAEILQTLTLNTNQSISFIIKITCRFRWFSCLYCLIWMYEQKESIFKIKNSNGFKIGHKPWHTSRYTCIKYLRFNKKK
jgi:hypothetical protein